MKTTLIAFVTALMMATGSLATVAPAEAASVVIKTGRHHAQMNRPRHRQVCRMVTRKKVVYRNHRRHVVVTRVRRCK